MADAFPTPRCQKCDEDICIGAFDECKCQNPPKKTFCGGCNEKTVKLLQLFARNLEQENALRSVLDTIRAEMACGGNTYAARQLLKQLENIVLPFLEAPAPLTHDEEAEEAKNRG